MMGARFSKQRLLQKVVDSHMVTKGDSLQGGTKWVRECQKI